MRSVAICALLVLGAGCLPRGPEPHGQQLLSVRSNITAQFLPRRDDGVTPLLVWEERADKSGSDLSVSEVGPTGEAGPLRKVAVSVEPAVALGNYCSGPSGFLPGVTADRRGRLLLRRSLPGRSPESNPPVYSWPLVRLDLVTGASEELGTIDFLQTACSADRLVTRADDGLFRAIEADGKVTVLERASQILMIDEKVFFIVGAEPATPGIPPTLGSLSVLLEDGTIKALADKILSLDQRTVGGVEMVLFSHTVAGSEDPEYVMVDPGTLQLSTLPAIPEYPYFDFSPDGRRMVLLKPPQDQGGPGELTFIDRQSGARETFSLETASIGTLPVFWRPGHDEAWIMGNGRVFIWRPGAGVTELAPVYPRNGLYEGDQMFSRDGAYWLSWGPEGPGQFGPVYLVSADDLTKRLRLNAPGTGLSGGQELPDGRLLVTTWTSLPERGDMSVVDPRAGTVRPLATGGLLVAAGEHRALALLHYVEKVYTGELTLVDIDSGVLTSLGENVRAFLLAVPSARDRLAPGEPVAFMVRSRLPSPYDGLWVTTLP